jgi:enolase
MGKIKHIFAREILASGGLPSLEVTVLLDDESAGEASVSYGVSAGSKEAFVLLDGDPSAGLGTSGIKRYNGNGMLKAVLNVNEKIAPLLVGRDSADQRAIDEIMIKADGTENKKNLGANAILGVSMAVARAAAANEELELYESLATHYSLPTTHYSLPKPMVVMIEGGKHADNSTDIQEYLVSALRNDKTAAENVRMEMEIYQKLKTLLKHEHLSTNVGNEGAFAPAGMGNNEKPLKLLVQAIEAAGFKPGVDAGLSLDAAASELYKNEQYILKTENKKLSSEKMIALAVEWFKKYPIVTAEDFLSEFDWAHWPILLKEAGDVKIVGDDLTVTNAKLLQKAVSLKAMNAILIKLNQAGTVTETMNCCLLAKEQNMATIPSHRGGGETNDTFFVDLAVAVGSEWIKVGPTRGERVCKYNRLMRIEEELNN